VHEKGKTWEQRIEVGPCTSQKCVKESYTSQPRSALWCCVMRFCDVLVSRAIAHATERTKSGHRYIAACDAMRRDE
jgi:hypothetical protein